MQSIALEHHLQTLSALPLKTILKVIIPVIFIIVAVIELSMAQLAMLALFSGLILAFFTRIEKMSSTNISSTQRFNKAGIDGGSFHHPSTAVKTKTGLIIADGGSFKRARFNLPH
ncbi:MAG: hypothetical protein QM479_16170 [Pseudomonadota bacterium]